MSPFRCPTCGKFVKNTQYTQNFYGDIMRVFGICKTHKEVDVEWDSYEDIVGWHEDD